MNHLQINDAITLKEKGTKPNKQAQLKTLLKPIIQKIRFAIKDKPIHLNLAKNGRSQIKFIRKIKPMKWE
ncbi:hypothetical protein M0G43_10200 [Subsaxibacter sp. CAU 1640]|uniref:hypothetical protein n=1 Tax=Subsaxibacter sp. CAU 1640 TaxID=2933271 RepID=UPI002003282C|nr:hypothetical protein [Subsaxibacter sp. CAU 1640]MCK7590943.1 hypothetical protein [Subsaxibacter sp. CAU 1640]